MKNELALVSTCLHQPAWVGLTDQDYGNTFCQVFKGGGAKLEKRLSKD